MHQWQQIRSLAASGHSIRQIARLLHLSRNTVKRALAHENAPRYERVSSSASLLEPFRSRIETGRRQGKTGVRLYKEAQGDGYAGSRATFYRFLETIDADRKTAPSPCLRFETDPGEQAQFDWSPYRLPFGETLTSVVVYALVCAFSRRVHFFPSLAENHEAVFEALDESFFHFGGVCRSLLVDNAKVFVLSHTAGRVVYNDAFLRLCGHYSIQPIASTPVHPQGKGKVENPFGTLEDHLIQGGTWRDFDQFAAELAAFETEFNDRVHDTTKEVPRLRFDRERGLLLPLPAARGVYLPRTLRTVSNDGLISFGGVRYYVPDVLVRQRVQVRCSQGRFLDLFALDGPRLIRHTLRPKGSPPVFAPVACPPRRSAAALPALLERFRSRYGPVSEQTEPFLAGLLARHSSHPAPVLERVLDLLSAVPLPLAAALLGEAVAFGLPSPVFVEELLRRHAKQVAPPLDAARLPLDSVWPDVAVERPLSLYDRALPPDLV